MHDFVALDVETANSNRHSICSIGMVRFKEGQMLESYYELINPDESFSQANSAIHVSRNMKFFFHPVFTM